MKRNILIVEDNKVHMEALEELLLEMENIQIFKAYNLAEAYYMLSLNDFNVFIIDIILNTDTKGDVSGIELVNHIREIKKYEFTPVIFITSLEDPKLCAYRDLHCYQYIEKPFDREYVRKTIRQALRYCNQSAPKAIAYFRKDGVLYSVKVPEVTHVVAQRGKTYIFTINDCLSLQYYTLAEVISKLESSDFVKCSRTTLVNKNYIEYVDMTNGYIKLRGVKDTIEVGSSVKKQLGEKLNKDV